MIKIALLGDFVQSSRAEARSLAYSRLHCYCHVLFSIPRGVSRTNNSMVFSVVDRPLFPLFSVHRFFYLFLSYICTIQPRFDTCIVGGLLVARIDMSGALSSYACMQ